MNAPRRDLAATFPLIPPAELAELLAPLTPAAAAAALADSREFAATADAAAGWLLAHPGAALGAALPGLWHARHAAIRGELPARTAAALGRIGARSWGDLIDLSPADLQDVAQFGEGCLRPLLALAVGEAVAGAARLGAPARLPLVAGLAPRPKPRIAERLLLSLELVARWGTDDLGAATVGELLAALAGPDPPGDIALAWGDLAATPLAGLFLRPGRVEALGERLADLCAVLGDRSRAVFLCRIAVDGYRTLKDLGDEFGVSRERIRQVELAGEARVRAALATTRFAPVSWRADGLRRALGVAAPPGLADAALDRAARGVPLGDKARGREILLWAAGPYRRDGETGWLLAGELPAPAVAEDCADGDGRIDIARLRGRLGELGLTPAATDEWLASLGQVRRFQDAWFVWSGDLAAKAARLLALWGRPATCDEIVRAIGSGYNLQSTRNRLFSDELFARVDPDRVALRAWGLEEYGGIAEAIDGEIARRGGSCPVAELVPALVTQFGLRELSIRSYLCAAMFVVERGVARRRTPADPPPAAPPLGTTPGLYLVSPDALAWRIEATADALRGSGRTLPAAVAGWLGLNLGDDVSLAAGGGAVRLTWRAASLMGPAIGSLRPALTRAGAELGDAALVVFRRAAGELEVRRIARDVLDAATGPDRLALLTGVPWQGVAADFAEALGRAVGADGTPAAVRAALAARGEPELAALVPGGEDRIAATQ